MPVKSGTDSLAKLEKNVHELYLHSQSVRFSFALSKVFEKYFWQLKCILEHYKLCSALKRKWIPLADQKDCQAGQF